MINLLRKAVGMKPRPSVDELVQRIEELEAWKDSVESVWPEVPNVTSN
jgi:BMFP domain-containing protein YqiC